MPLRMDANPSARLAIIAAAPPRPRLNGNRTYYVRSDGLDTNTGLLDTSAFLTFNRAVAAIALIDGGGHDVTIQGDNTVHTDGINIGIPFVGIGSLFIDCDGGTISTTGTTALIFSSSPPLGIYLSNMKLQSSGFECNAISLGTDVNVQINEGVIFGSVGDVHIDIEWPGSTVYVNNNYTITGGGNHHIYLNCPGSWIRTSGQTITLTGTPAFSTAFVQMRGPCMGLMPGLTFVGSATGVRYLAVQNGVIDTGGGGANYFPGNSAGSTASGGQYV